MHERVHAHPWPPLPLRSRELPGLNLHPSCLGLAPMWHGWPSSWTAPGTACLKSACCRGLGGPVRCGCAGLKPPATEASMAWLQWGCATPVHGCHHLPLHGAALHILCCRSPARQNRVGGTPSAGASPAPEQYGGRIFTSHPGSQARAKRQHAGATCPARWAAEWPGMPGGLT